MRVSVYIDFICKSSLFFASQSELYVFVFTVFCAELHYTERKKKKLCGMTRMPLTFLPSIYVGRALPSDWWDEINESTQWQDWIFFALCAAYGLVSAVALVHPLYLLYLILCVYVLNWYLSSSLCCVWLLRKGWNYVLGS